MKIFSWNIGTFEGKEGTVLKQENVEGKLSVLKDLVEHENPDIFCVVEGTVAKGNNQLEILFNSLDYFTYYSPEFVSKPEYKGLFEFKNFETYGIKIFVKNKAKSNIKPFDPSKAIHKGRLVRLELNKSKEQLIFLHRNMSRPAKEQHEFISAIHDWCFKAGLGVDSNIFVIGDFNLTPWSSDYFTTDSGYLISEFVESVYELKNRTELCFYNPIINWMTKTAQKNLGGTFYSNNFGWGIFDFVLIKEFDEAKHYFEVVTQSKNHEILDISNLTKTKDFIKHNFDHLPIKLTITS